MSFNTFAKAAGIGVAVYLYGQACRVYGFVEGLLFSKEVVDNVFEKRKEREQKDWQQNYDYYNVRYYG